jgi:hypothetical protein
MGMSQKEQNSAQSNISHLKDTCDQMMKRESKYADYIGRLEAKLVEQAKLLHSWTKG